MRSHKHIHAENAFNKTLIIMALIVLIIVLGIVLTLAFQSTLSMKALGIKFYGERFGILLWKYFKLFVFNWNFIYIILGLIISIPFSFSVATILGEYYPRGWFSDALKNVIELIAAIPSVIYGFWGIV